MPVSVQCAAARALMLASALPLFIAACSSSTVPDATVYPDGDASTGGLDRDAGSIALASDATSDRSVLDARVADAKDDVVDASTDDAAPCTSGQRTTEACGRCGQQQGYCAGGQWVWDVCKDEAGDCLPNATRAVVCGKCGSGTEICSNACHWQIATCTGQGTCWPGEGDVTSTGCASGAASARVCSATCAWPTWGACTTPPSGWRNMARSPLGGRSSAIAEWTGREVLFWGGSGPPDGYASDGAAYNPTTDTWRMLPKAPLPGRWGAAFAWTGSSLVVWGGQGLKGAAVDGGPPRTAEPLGDGAAFDPVAQSWTTLPTAGAPSARSRASFVWSTTTHELIVWGGWGVGGGPPLTDGGAFSPTSNTWRTLATSPLSERWNQTAVWNGSKMVVFGGYYAVAGTTYTRSDAAEYDPVTDAWTSITTTSSGLGARALLGATTPSNGRLIFYGGQDNAILGAGALYDDASNVWTPLRAPKPTEVASSRRRDALLWWANDRLWMWGGFSGNWDMGGASYDFATDTWTSFPDGFTDEHRDAQRVWTGSELVVWGGNDVIGYFADGKVYRP